MPGPGLSLPGVCAQVLDTPSPPRGRNLLLCGQQYLMAFPCGSSSWGASTSFGGPRMQFLEAKSTAVDFQHQLLISVSRLQRPGRSLTSQSAGMSRSNLQLHHLLMNSIFNVHWGGPALVQREQRLSWRARRGTVGPRLAHAAADLGSEMGFYPPFTAPDSCGFPIPARRGFSLGCRGSAGARQHWL